MYIYYKALSFGKNVRIKNFSFSFLLIIRSVYIANKWAFEISVYDDCNVYGII